MSRCRHIFPNNVFQATMQQVQTKFVNRSTVRIVSMNETRVEWLDLQWEL